MNIRGAACCIAAEGVIHTAHGGGLSIDEAMRIDCEAVQTMSGAMASHKPLIMSSGCMATLVFRGLSLKTAVDPDHARVLAEQVRVIMSSSLNALKNGKRH